MVRPGIRTVGRLGELIVGYLTAMPISGADDATEEGSPRRSREGGSLVEVEEDRMWRLYKEWRCPRHRGKLLYFKPDQIHPLLACCSKMNHDHPQTSLRPPFQSCVDLLQLIRPSNRRKRLFVCKHITDAATLICHNLRIQKITHDRSKNSAELVK